MRPDIAIFTNRDAIRVNPRLSDFLIPVEWREDLRDRAKMKETLRLTSRAFAEERAVVIFPSGRIAYWAEGKLNERPWMSSAVTLARKQGLPVLPVNVRRAKLLALLLVRQFGVHRAARHDRLPRAPEQERQDL